MQQTIGGLFLIPNLNFSTCFVQIHVKTHSDFCDNCSFCADDNGGGVNNRSFSVDKDIPASRSLGLVDRKVILPQKAGQ